MQKRVHVVNINGRKTSISIEDEFWFALREIAVSRGTNITGVIADIDRGRLEGGLTSAIRVSVLKHFRGLAHADGFRRAKT